MESEDIKFGKDHTANWRWFFPVRNNIQPEMKVNRNFDRETLNYMSAPGAADKITKNVVDRMRGKKFFVIECCAGIGGNTLSFLNNPQIWGVKAYERNPMRRLWLKRNIMAYDLGGKAIVPEIGEEGLHGTENFDEFKEAVFYFDPPWLPADYKGGKDYKKYYIKKNMKVGDKTLEQWMETYKSVASMMVFRVPPGCVIEKVKGWTFELENLGDSGLVYYCFNNVISGSNNGTKTTVKAVMNFSDISFKDVPFTNEGGFGSLIRTFELCRIPEESNNPQCRIFLKYSFVDPEPPSEAVKQGPPVKEVEKEEVEEIMPPIVDESAIGAGVIFRGTTRNNFIRLFQDTSKPKASPDSEEWVAELQEYIYKVLLKIAGREDICKRMVGPDVMWMWVKAFTHESYDSSIENNYENYEKLGDSFSAAAFNLMVYNRFDGNVGKDWISNYKNIYMAKVFQADISRMMRLGDWVRITVEGKTKATINVYEDSFESFTGALHQVGDTVKDGFGQVLVRKFIIDVVFKGVDLDERYKYGVPKTTVTQWFQGLGYDNQYKVEKIGDSTIQIILNDSLFQALKGWFPKLERRVIAEARGNPKALKSATDQAWYQAQVFLESIGMNRDSVNEIKNEMKISSLEEMDPVLVKLVTSKLRREGYEKYMIQMVQSAASAESRTAKLVGVIMERRGGKDVETERVLAIASGPNETQAKLAVLTEYKNKLT